MFYLFDPPPPPDPEYLINTNISIYICCGGVEVLFLHLLSCHVYYQEKGAMNGGELLSLYGSGLNQ